MIGCIAIGYSRLIAFAKIDTTCNTPHNPRAILFADDRNDAFAALSTIDSPHLIFNNFDAPFSQLLESDTVVPGKELIVHLY
jgi:hypothetical protein